MIRKGIIFPGAMGSKKACGTSLEKNSTLEQLKKKGSSASAPLFGEGTVRRWTFRSRFDRLDALDSGTGNQ
jgi:hypothetical protein